MSKVTIKFIFCLFMFTIGLMSCEKQEVGIVKDATEEISVLREKTLSEVMVLGKSPEFRQFILKECLKQKHGDYNVYLSDVIASYRGKSGYEKSISALEKLVEKTKKMTNGREPLIFYPRAETIEDNRKKSISSKKVEDEFLQNPIGVYEEVSGPDYTSPGYTLDNGYSLVFYQHITEAYAWENDVWVVSEEENVSVGNMVLAEENYFLNPLRINGEAEYGGIIQVTDLNSLESWINGKLEFRYIVNSAAGVLIKDRAFGKTKRKYFKNLRWQDYNDFIANWNTSNIGNWLIEGWIEEDGGSSTNTVTQSYPAPCTGCPTTTISYTKQSKDQDLGRSIVQFTDSKDQVYNISYSNFKHK
jgi:hypothetical protein